MTTFVLVPGAGGQASYWDRVVPELRRRGHRAIAVDIPEDDPGLGLRDWAAVVDAAVPEGVSPVLVAQSLGGFVAPLVTRPLERIVLVNAMVPVPGEAPGAWWAAVGAVEARHALADAEGRPREFDLESSFLHDVPADVKAEMLAGEQRDVCDEAFASRCDFARWPAPVEVVVGADDRFLPADLQRRVARERLGVDALVVPGGHLIAKSRPDVLVAQLLATAAGS